jgi:hypothetical protein
VTDNKDVLVHAGQGYKFQQRCEKQSMGLEVSKHFIKVAFLSLFTKKKTQTLQQDF